jgi:hypothetical protein
MIALSRYLIIICYTAAICACSTFGLYADTTDMPNYIQRVGFLENKDIEEASGIAASRLRSNLLWLLNDSGNPAILYAVSVEGASMGSAIVENVYNTDWEDLAAFIYDGKAYLLIADVGDNKARRDTCSLVIVEEPDLPPNAIKERIAVKPAWRLIFRYEDGPRDCESVAVDTPKKRILLLSKRTEPPVLYELPLLPGDNNPPISTARRLTPVHTIKPLKQSETGTDSFLELFQNKPTAMDISPDGSFLAVLTYNQFVLYYRNSKTEWEDIVNRQPVGLPLPELDQAESMCFGADGDSVFITSENLPAPLLRMDIRKIDPLR